MTKLFSLLCLSFVAVTLTACNQTTSPQIEETAPSSPVQTESEESIEAPTETSADITSAPTSEQNTAFSLQDSLRLINQFPLRNEPNFVSCSYASLLSCQDQVANQKAVADKSVEVCDNIMDEDQALNCKNQLWYQLATIDRNSELCANITQEGFKDTCRNEISFAQASAENNAELCNSISDPYQTDNCKNQVAIALAVEAQDRALCDAVKAYEYTFVQTESPTSAESANDEAPDFNNPEEIVRVELEDDQNFMKQECLNAVEQAIEFQAFEEAAQAATEAATTDESTDDLEGTDTES